MDPSPAPAPWPVVERWDLFDQIARAEHGCVVIGPAGSGKSTAARAALAGREPAEIAGVVGLSNIPLGALSMAEMTRPMPAAPPAAGGVDDLVARLRRWLGALRATGTPVVIDDPAGLDADSVVMLADEIRRGLHSIVTHRASQPPPAGIQDALDERGLPTFVVEPFDPSMVGLAIEQAVGAEPDPDTVAQLAAVSGGNPMLLREIVLDLSARGAWTRRGALVGLAAGIDPSHRMGELLQTRFPTSNAGAHLLGLVGITGWLPRDLAVQLADPETVGDLIDRGWLVDGPRVTMAHPLMTQFVRDRLDEAGEIALLRAALARLASRAAATVDPQPADPEHRLVTLRWALVAGADLDDADLRWGRGQAARRFDHDLACLIADRLSTRAHSLDATLELALVLAQAGRYDEVVAVLERSRAEATDEVAVVETSRFLLRFAGPLARLKRWGDPPAGLDRDTAGWADAELGTTAFTDLLAAFQALGDGALREARDRADAVRASGVAGLGGDADEVIMLASLYSGDQDEALAAFDRLGARLDDVGYRHPKAVVIDAAASSLLMLSGRFEQAYDFDHRMQEVARAQDDDERCREMTGHLGMTALFLGRVDGAIEAFGRHRDYPAAPNSLRTLYTAGLAQSLALGGRLAEAEQALADAEREQAVVSPMMVTDFENLTAMTLFLLGQTDEGERRMRQALAGAEAWTNHRAELMALHGLARMGRVRVEDLRAADERVGRGAIEPAPAFATGVLTMVHAAHAGDPAGLAEAAAHFASTGMALGAAEGYAAACRAATDRTGAAHARALAELDAWLARCPGLCGATVLVARGVEALTGREHEIAALAAGGLTNPDIADRLGISGRTVENSLHRTFTKLGIATRAAIGPAMLPGTRP